MTTLVCAAHPDDEVLGCGGTIARKTARGEEVHIAIFGEGLTSREESRDKVDTSALERLKEHARKAAAIMGANEPSFHGLPDNRFDTVALLDIVHKVEELVARFEPKTMYTHHPGDLNIDHTLLHRAVVTATRPMADGPVDALYAFEIPSSSEWRFRGGEDAFEPTDFVDISDTLEVKLQAMAAYETEIRDPPHPRSLRSLKALAQWRGSTVGCDAAEAFQTVRTVK